MDSRNWFLSNTHRQQDRESFLNSAICTKVGFTHLWGFEIHVLAESCEILYRGYHQGNISRLFLEMRGGKYLLKKADIVSCCPGTSLVFPPHKNLAVLSLAWCNLRLCVTPELVNRRWLCLWLCTAFQSNHYIKYQSLRLWLWYSTDTPVIGICAARVPAALVCLRRRFPVVSIVHSSLPDLTLAIQQGGCQAKFWIQIHPNCIALHPMSLWLDGWLWGMSATDEVQGCRWNSDWINLSRLLVKSM